jgi:putative lipoic acid-binding regulatory protein
LSEGDRVSSAVDHQRSIDLLEANHVFPGDYSFSVIAHNADAVTAAVIAAIEAELGASLPGEAREARPSSQGKYVSHRLRVHCQSAAQVLALYARVRAVEGVVTVL